MKINMLRAFPKFIFASLIVLSLLSFGCKNETKRTYTRQQEQKSIEHKNDISGERFGYIKQIDLKDGNYFASIVFLEYRIKSEDGKAKSTAKFADSLEVLELPDGYYFCLKGKSPETILIDTSAEIIMQTLSHDPSGTYKFNEIVKIKRLHELYSTKKAERFAQIPFRFSIKQNTIQSITEKYIP